MRSILKRICVLLLVLAMLPVIPAFAAETAAEDRETAAGATAVDITDTTEREVTGINYYGRLFDKDINLHFGSSATVTIHLTNEQGMGSLYMIFSLEPETYTITDNATGNTVEAGLDGFLHEYIDLVAAFGTAPKDITLQFDNGPVYLAEIYVYSEGEVPSSVQKWKAPAEGCADIVLFSTHGDDEQLFFAGMIPYYAKELGYNVQVVYLTDHRNLTYYRTHEMLNGLWAVGAEYYPVFGSFPDFLIESRSGTYDQFYDYGFTREVLNNFAIENIRRFKPMVAIGHDPLQGEYGHGQHMVYAEMVMNGVEKASDATVHPESAEKYGTWDTPKTYFHLYPENPIVLDWDQPLESFDGMTAFEVTQKLGFPCHVSQQWTWFNGWINGKNTPITKASEITTHSPCQFGLYRTTVGEDVAKNDFFENLQTHAQLAAQQEPEPNEETTPIEETKAPSPIDDALAAIDQAANDRAEQTVQQREENAADFKFALYLAFGAFVAIAVAGTVVFFVSRKNRKKRKKRRK